MSAPLFSGAEHRLTAMAQSYAAGASLQKLAIAHSTSKTTIANWLRRYGVAPRSRGQRCDVVLDHAAFDLPSPERSYWIGFLLTDGCVLDRPGRQRTVSLALAERDSDHVRAFARFCGVAGACYGARVSFGSNRITDALATFGVVPRKTGIESAPEMLRLDRDFWRGAVDGDGWISESRHGYPVAGLCGSETLCRQFCEYVATFATSRAAPLRIKGKNCWMVTFHGSPARAILATLYRTGDVALARKATLAATVNVVLYDRMAKLARSRA